MKFISTLTIVLITKLALTSCSGPTPKSAPTRDTPTGAKVDLTGVSMSIDQATITPTKDGKHQLRFNYIIDNTSGTNIQFPCIYANMNDLLDIKLSDKDSNPILLERSDLDGLTLPQPRPRRIVVGKVTRSYSVPIAANALKGNDLINVQVRFHAPSRYDELRSSLIAPLQTLAWPTDPVQEKP